jgi:putative hemolysin
MIMCYQKEKMMKKLLIFAICLIFLTSCSLNRDGSETSPSTDDSQANMPNPASVYCEENGGTLEIRKDAEGNEYGYCFFPDGSECDEWAYYRGECNPGDSLGGNANMPNPASVYCEENGGTVKIITAEDGSQSGVCVFPDGSECDEWSYFRGECEPGSENPGSPSDVEIPTAIPINPADYEGWLTYTHPEYGFSIMLPENWVVEDSAAADPLLSGHILNLHPNETNPEEGSLIQNIRMTFRLSGEDVLLWPTGVGQGEFIQQGTLDIAGDPAQRILLVCPTGEVTAIWYHDGEGQPNITRGDMEFGFIYSSGSHCEPGVSLGGKIQYVGEMIIASLIVPE